MLLTFVTRACRRPEKLRRNIASVKKQTSDDWEQLLLVDRAGEHGSEDPIVWANGQFQRYDDCIKGRYIYMLDDDCFLISTLFVEHVERWAREFDDPDVILVKMRTYNLDQTWRTHPEPPVWEVNWEAGEKPGRWVGNGLCVVTRADTWREFIEYYRYAPGGDWHFITTMMNRPHIRFVRLNEVVAESPGRGCGVLFEKCNEDWFDEIASEFEPEHLRDDAWRLSA